MTAGEGIYREADLMNPDDDTSIYRPAGLGGEGWWDDAVVGMDAAACPPEHTPRARARARAVVVDAPWSIDGFE